MFLPKTALLAAPGNLTASVTVIIPGLFCFFKSMLWKAGCGTAVKHYPVIPPEIVMAKHVAGAPGEVVSQNRTSRGLFTVGGCG